MSRREESLNRREESVSRQEKTEKESVSRQEESFKREKESVDGKGITMVMEGSVKREEVVIQEHVISEAGSKEKQHERVLIVPIERSSQPSDPHTDPLSKHSKATVHKNSEQVHNTEVEEKRPAVLKSVQETKDKAQPLEKDRQAEIGTIHEEYKNGNR